MFRTPVDVAIDKHLVGRYDKFSRIVNTIKSKYKNGTCDFNCLATANCTTDGSRAFLAARLVRRGDANVDVVSGLISDCKKKRIGIRSMKVDREFFSVGMINLLESLKILFMVPAIKTKGVKKAVREFESGTREAVSRHFIESDCGRADFTLIIQKRENGYFTLATSATVQEVLGFKSGSLKGAEGFAELYRLRCGDCVQGLRIHPPPYGKQERVHADPAAVLSDVSLQRVGAGPAHASILLPGHARDTQEGSQAVSRVREGIGPGQAPDMTCAF